MTALIHALIAFSVLGAPPTDQPADADAALLLGDDLVLRLDAAEDVSLHALPQPLVIELDLDIDAATGDTGVDARITFSPERSRDGVRLAVIDGTGFAQPRTTLDADLAITPSFSARQFDIRINPRRLAALAGVPYEGQVRGRIDSAGPAFSDQTFSVTAAAAPSVQRRLPTKPEGAVRIASFNVERSSPMRKPEPFAQLMGAMDADVYLLQEWDLAVEPFRDADADRLTAWFDEHLSGGPWHAAVGEGGVAIVSRYAITHRGTDGSAPDLRYVVASLEAPLGVLTVASVHLKCCGSPGSEEDQTRILQAQAIHRDLLTDIPAEQRRQLIIGGDLNLVGTRWPLLHLIDDLDADGSDLLPVDTPVLGDAMRYTWRHPAHPFALGRLDYLLVSDATLAVVHSFALDTLRLDPPPAPLTPATSSASDHLPIVVDVRPR